MSKTAKRVFIILLAVILPAAASKHLATTGKLHTVDFVAQYLSVGYHDEEEYPKAVVIRNPAELSAYYASRPSYNDKPFIPRKTEEYDDNYFTDHILVIASLCAGSGGDRFAVNSIIKTGDGLSIDIRQTQNGVTCDMAAWHILIELDRTYDTDIENIQVNLP